MSGRSRIVLAFCVQICAAAVPPPSREIFFEPNLGQAAREIRFLSRTPGAVIAWSEDGLTLVPVADPSRPLKIRFSGALSASRLEPSGDSGGRTSYYRGADRSAWTPNVPQFRRLAWRGLYPGIDAEFYSSEGRLEFDFVLAPGADPGRIQLAFDGGPPPALARAGALAFSAPDGSLELLKPRLYQRKAGRVRAVAGQWRLSAPGVAGFSVGAYDPALPLVIDPVLLAGAWFGGEKDESVVAVTPNGDLVGVTNSVSFANTSSAVPRRSRDIFIQSAARGRLILGGSGDDVPTCAASDSSVLVVAGWTNSADFPDTAPLGGTDGFLLALDLTSSLPPALLRLGGSGNDRINALWGTGANTYFAGETASADLTLAGNPLATQLNGASDAFLGQAFTGPAAVSLLALAYFGGSGDERANAVAVDSAGQIVIAGRTTSKDLPVVNPVSGQLAGPSDAFVARTPAIPAASAPVFSFVSYWGGSGDDEIRAVTPEFPGVPLAAPAPVGLYFAGSTSSTDLPLVHPVQPQYGGGDSDGFFGRLEPGPGRITFSTYLGGSGRDEINAVSVPASPGGVYAGGGPALAGSTTSPDLPVQNALQPQLAGPQDAFLAAFSVSGSLLALSYFGGSGSDRGLALSAKPDGSFTLAGETDSSDLPVLVPGAEPSAYSGGLDGFAASLALPFFDVSAGPGGFWTGQNVTVYGTLNLPPSVPDTATVTVTSGDSARLGVSLNRAAAPAPSASLPAGDLRKLAGLLPLTGLAPSGETTVTVAVDSLGTRTLRVRLAPPVVAISAPFQKTAWVGDSADYLAATLGVFDDSGLFIAGTPRVDGPPVSIDLSLTDPTLGTLTPPRLQITDGTASALFTPKAAGDETLLLSAPGVTLAGGAEIRFTVADPLFTLPDFTAAHLLDSQITLRRDRSNSYADTFTVASSDPARLCLVDLFRLCQPAISFTSRSALTVRALDDKGTVSLRYSSARQAERTAVVQLARPQIAMFQSAPAMQGDPVSLTTGYGPPGLPPDPATRPAVDPGLSLSSSDTSVAALLGTSGNAPVLSAVGPGVATITATVSPDFDPPPPFPVRVTARALDVSAGPVTIGKDLQAVLRAQLPGESASLGVPVSVTSADPARLLVSLDRNAAGTATATGVNGVFFLQALAAAGTVDVAVSAAGYPGSVISVRLAASGAAWTQSGWLVAAGSNALLPYSGYALDGDSLLPFLAQDYRPGMPLPAVASSNPDVGTAVPVNNGTALAFHAATPGTTVLSVSSPADGLTPAVRTSMTVTVTPP